MASARPRGAGPLLKSVGQAAPEPTHPVGLIWGHSTAGGQGGTSLPWGGRGGDRMTSWHGRPAWIGCISVIGATGTFPQVAQSVFQANSGFITPVRSRWGDKAFFVPGVQMGTLKTCPARWQGQGGEEVPSSRPPLSNSGSEPHSACPGPRGAGQAQGEGGGRRLRASTADPGPLTQGRNWVTACSPRHWHWPQVTREVSGLCKQGLLPVPGLSGVGVGG